MPGRRRLALALLIACGACAHRVGPAARSDSTPAARPSESPFELSVENHNWLDITLYVEHDGMRERVGLATAATTSTLVLPGRLVGQGGILQLVADPVGARGSLVSEPVSVGPLRRVVWTIESDLRRSSVASW